ncbi:MAG: ABC transporter permease [Flavobacterium sp.]|nr:MAG: ABC transporter permease [Flavobacterium sp.]
MSFSFYIARRYTISRSKSTAVNIITRIAALGIVVSTAALFVILSVFSGLKDYSIAFTNTTDPDLKISAALGKSFTISPQQEQQLKAIKGVAAYSKTVEERVLFYFNEKEQVAYLKGVDSVFTDVSGMQKQLVAGLWLEPETPQVVVGYGIVQKLSMGLSEFDHLLEVFVPKPGKGAIESEEDAFNKSSLVPMGIYSVNDDVNSKYVFCTLSLAQDLLQFQPNTITSVEFKLAPGASENDVRQKLSAIFGNKITTMNRAQLNDSLYKMLNAENLVTYLFCSLVVIITLFCLAGALIMLILDKRENIRTMYNLGAEISSLRNIFLYQGFFITTLGAFFGLAIGCGITILQEQYHLIMLTNDLAYPVNFNAENIITVVLTIFPLGFLASYIAAGRVKATLLKN